MYTPKAFKENKAKGDMGLRFKSSWAWLECFAVEWMLMVMQQSFRNPKAELLAILKESGPVGETNGTTTAPKPKRKPQSRSVDMEKLADALPQLQEDDLLQIVQMVHDNKSEETYTKNDLESEYHAHLPSISPHLQ